MTDNEIIKALECCLQKDGNCDGCPYKGYQCISEKGENVFYKDILDLINRQKAEVEKKDIEIDILIRKKETLCDEISELRAEVERLKNAYKQCAWERDTFLEETKTAKSEAIKEFAERLKKEFIVKPNYHNATMYVCAVVIQTVDNLVKEMVGEKDV